MIIPDARIASHYNPIKRTGALLQVKWGVGNTSDSTGYVQMYLHLVWEYWVLRAGKGDAPRDETLVATEVISMDPGQRTHLEMGYIIPLKPMETIFAYEIRLIDRGFDPPVIVGIHDFLSTNWDLSRPWD